MWFSVGFASETKLHGLRHLSPTSCANSANHALQSESEMWPEGD
jgi:hypothetical protein